MRNIRKSDDRTIGALVVSGVLGLVAAGAMNVAWGLGFAATAALFVLIAGLLTAVLVLGWRDAQPTAGRTTPAKGVAPSQAAAAASPEARGLAATVALHTPLPEAHADHVSISGTVEMHNPVPEHVQPEPPQAPSGPGTRPAALDAPRDGSADNLQLIKGIGPALEKLCNSLGFYHFDQIAAWSAPEIAWVDQNLEGFKGRVTRDGWVDQAQTLASGGTTAHSEKVEKGAVS